MFLSKNDQKPLTEQKLQEFDEKLEKLLLSGKKNNEKETVK